MIIKAIVNKIQNFESLSPYSGEYFKLKNWVEGVNKVPFGVYKKPIVSLSSSSKKNIKKYLDKVKTDMDGAVYGHDNAKKQILQVIAQTITKSKNGDHHCCNVNFGTCTWGFTLGPLPT